MSKLTLTIQFKGPTEEKPYRSGKLVSFGEQYVWSDDYYLYASFFNPCERKNADTFKYSPEIAWYLSDIEWYKIDVNSEEKCDEEFDIHDLNAPFEGIASPLQLLKNYCMSQSMAWNKRTMNWVKVQQALLYGTSHDGCTSSMNLCNWLGIDPYGYTFEGAKDR